MDTKMPKGGPKQSEPGLRMAIVTLEEHCITGSYVTTNVTMNTRETIHHLDHMQDINVKLIIRVRK